MNLDLTDAVDVAARAQWKRMTRTSVTFDELNPIDQHACRSIVLPILTAAAPVLVEQALAPVRAFHDEWGSFDADAFDSLEWWEALGRILKATS